MWPWPRGFLLARSTRKVRLTEAGQQYYDRVQDMAQDFEEYYLQNRYTEPEQTEDLLILTFDGKGIVMRPDSLRECTRKRAEKTNKLTSRLSAGEKRDRKRMAQVASVHSLLPHPRSAESIEFKLKR